MSPRWPIPEGLNVCHVDGYPLAYQEAGEGEPVVLIHGSLNDYRSWVAQVPLLSKQYRVLAPSLRHYFPEPWDGNGNDFSLSVHASDVIALIRALGLPKVHLVGHSRGGSVAYLVARHAPDLVRSLVLAEPRGLEDLLDPGAAEQDGARSNAGIFAALQDNILRKGKVEAAQAFVDAFNGAGSWKAMSSSQKTIILDNIATGIDGGELPGMRCEEIAGFDFPILLVRGEKSLERYRYGLEAMRRCNPSIGKVAVIPGAPHGMHRINPHAFNAAVLGFLATVK